MNTVRTSGVPVPLVSRSRVIRLVGRGAPPEVAMASIQCITRSFGRSIGAVVGPTDSTTSTSPFGRL
jgi:hypothetical protein